MILGLNAKFAPGHSEFLSDVRTEKEAIGDVPGLNDLGKIIQDEYVKTCQKCQCQELSKNPIKILSS